MGLIHLFINHRNIEAMGERKGGQRWLTIALTVSLALGVALSANAQPAGGDTPSVGIRTATLWWVIFNEPTACNANPGEAEQCGEVDVFGQPYLDSVAAGMPDPTLIAPNTDAGLAVIYATGGKTDWYGRIRLTASIYRSTGPLTFSGPSVVDPLGLANGFTHPDAEVHLVVREHGEAVPGDLSTQTLNFLEPFCSDPRLAFEGGENLCQDTQFAIFAPAESGQDAVFAFASPQAPVSQARAILVRNGDMLQAIVETQLGQ